MKDLQASVEGLQLGVQALREDFGDMKTDLRRVEDTMNVRFSDLQSSVDQYLKRTESWHDEQVILKARHDRLSDSLVRKGIVTKEETLL